MKIAIDDVMLALLEQGTPMPLGLPHWALHELTTRKDYPYDPAILLGLEENECESSLLNQYENRQGYQFTWGVISDVNDHFADDPEEIRILTFEISSESVLKTFMQPAMLQDLYTFMYENHPEYNDRFECGEPFGDLYTMQFSATGGPVAHSELREWMVHTFIPVILPD